MTDEPGDAGCGDLVRGADHPVEVLLRWAGSGAIWRVLARTPERLEIVLLACTGDEEMGRLTSSDPELLAFVGDRAGSDG